MNTVGANRNIDMLDDLAAGAVGEDEFDVIVAHAGGDAPVVQAKVASGQRLLQHRQQIGPMRHITMGAVQALAFGAHRLNEQHLPVLPAAELPRCLQTHRESLQRITQPKSGQGPHHVGRDHQAGAHLAQLRRLLVDSRLQPGATQEQGGRETADAAAHDGDAQACRNRGLGPGIHVASCLPCRNTLILARTADVERARQRHCRWRPGCGERKCMETPRAARPECAHAR